MLTTQQCADRLNAAYGWRAVTRQRLMRDITAGRLEASVVPAIGTRLRSYVRVDERAFDAYASVYHPVFHVKQAASPLSR